MTWKAFRDRSPRHVGKHYDDLAAFTDPNFPVPFDLQRLLGTIDTLFSQAGPAPALEVGNRLRTLSQILVSLSQASKQQPLLLLLSNNKGVTKHPIAHGRTFERKGDEKRRKKLTRSFAFAPPFPLPIASAKGQQETKAFKDANPNGQRDASVPSRGPRFSGVAARGEPA